MKIAAFTIGDINRASSRLRSFYLFDLAEKFNLAVSRPKRFRDALGVDVVHIQKKLSFKTIVAVIVYRLLMIKVVFDIDDQPVSKKAFFGYFIVLFFSSIITVDTEARKKYWASFFLNKIIVVNDIADSNHIKLKINSRRCKLNPDGFFWIGYSANLASLDSFITLLKKNKKYKLTVSTEKNAVPIFKKKYPFVEFFPWFDGIANDDCIDGKFMILNHNHDSSTLLKSDNKMVLAILAGFIPIVSRSPSYAKLANSLNADFLIFDNVADVIEISKELSNIDLETFLPKFLTYINAHYSRKAVLSEFNRKVLCR
jgi:hypothetical protein